MSKPQKGFPIETVEETLAFLGANAEQLFKSEMLTDILVNMAAALKEEDPTNVVHAAVLMVVVVNEETEEIKGLQGVDMISRGSAKALAHFLRELADDAEAASRRKDIDA